MTTYDKKRLILALLLLLMILSAANYYLNLGFFPRYARLVQDLGLLLLLVGITRFRPTKQDFEQHQSLKGAEHVPDTYTVTPPTDLEDPSHRGTAADSAKFSEYYRRSADDELARIALSNHLVPAAQEALTIELQRRGLKDLSEYKKSPEEFPETLVASREPDASAHARPEWALVLGAWVIAAILPIVFEVRGASRSDSVTFLVVGSLYIAVSCHHGIKARRQGLKRGFVLKFILPLILLGLSATFVVLCNILLGSAFWTAFS